VVAAPHHWDISDVLFARVNPLILRKRLRGLLCTRRSQGETRHGPLLHRSACCRRPAAWSQPSRLEVATSWSSMAREHGDHGVSRNQARVARTRWGVRFGSEAVTLSVSICFPNSTIKPTSSEAHSGLGPRRFWRGPRKWIATLTIAAVDGASRTTEGVASQPVRVAQS
jgi:hypothetical protein